MRYVYLVIESCHLGNTIYPNRVCFSSSSLVSLSTGDTVSVSELKPGDRLKSANTDDDPFLGWLHRDDNLTATFLDITTATGNKVSLSPLHLLMVADKGDTRPGMRFASSVNVGDHLAAPHLKIIGDGRLKMSQM